MLSTQYFNIKTTISHLSFNIETHFIKLKILETITVSEQNINKHWAKVQMSQPIIDKGDGILELDTKQHLIN